MGGQHHAPAALPAGEPRYPLYRRLGGPRGRSGLIISLPPGFDPPDLSSSWRVALPTELSWLPASDTVELRLIYLIPTHDQNCHSYCEKESAVWKVTLSLPDSVTGAADQNIHARCHHLSSVRHRTGDTLIGAV